MAFYFMLGVDHFIKMVPLDTTWTTAALDNLKQKPNLGL
jgi:hypothetical protein